MANDLPPDPLITELIRIRREQRLSRIELAVAIGVNINSVENWEAGLADPGYRKVVRWAKVLGYEFDLHPLEEN